MFPGQIQPPVATPPGADRRFRYASFEYVLSTEFAFEALSKNSVEKKTIAHRIGMMYPYSEPWLPKEAYLYPIKKNGRLAKASRYMPHDRAVELYNEYQVRTVMES
jgi:hypothetical protein